MPIPYYPHQIVSMDLVGPLPRSRHGHQYLLTLIDHLTGWADVFPIANKTSSTIAEILATRYIPLYGASEIIISDNGNEFCNREVAGLLTAYGIAHHRTTAYHPQANGKIERFHSRTANQQRMAKRPEGAKLKVGDSALLRKPGLQPSFSPKWEQEWVVKRVRHPT